MKYELTLTDIEEYKDLVFDPIRNIESLNERYQRARLNLQNSRTSGEFWDSYDHLRLKTFFREENQHELDFKIAQEVFRMIKSDLYHYRINVPQDKYLN